MSYKINKFVSTDKPVASYEKRLSICLESNGFSFSVISVRNELMEYCEVECDTKVPMSDMLTTVRGVLSETNLQPFGLKDKELTVMSRQFVWIPEHLYDASRQRTYIEAVGKIDTGMGVYTDFNEEICAHMVFTADSGLVSAFKIAIPGLKVRCQHSKMVSAETIGGSDMKSVLMVNIRRGESDYAVICNKKLQISNTFDCTTFDETLYHALNLTKQFHLEDALMTVSVSGMVDREQFMQMRGFFPNVTLNAGRKLRLTVPEMQHIRTYRQALLFM